MSEFFIEEIKSVNTEKFGSGAGSKPMLTNAQRFSDYQDNDTEPEWR